MSVGHCHVQYTRAGCGWPICDRLLCPRSEGLSVLRGEDAANAQSALETEREKLIEAATRIARIDTVRPTPCRNV